MHDASHHGNCTLSFYSPRGETLSSHTQKYWREPVSSNDQNEQTNERKKRVSIRSEITEIAEAMHMIESTFKFRIEFICTQFFFIPGARLFGMDTVERANLHLSSGRGTSFPAMIVRIYELSNWMREKKKRSISSETVVCLMCVCADETTSKK